MKRIVVLGVLAGVIAAAIAVAASGSPPPDVVAGQARGLVFPHGAHSGGAAKATPNMTYHGGAIMPGATIKAIYWGSSWNDSSFVGDKITGLDSFYTGFSNSNYAMTSDEYAGANGQVVGPTV